MYSLLDRVTLLIGTVLVLTSYAIQTQAVNGSIEGESNTNAYARQYMDERASSEGLSKPEWYGGGTDEYSFAKVTYKDQLGFMKCIPGTEEEEAFKTLMAAKKKLKGSYGAFRDTVAYPLKRIKVEADGASRPLGNCYVYRYIDGVLLWKYISKENYAEQLITMDETTPQMLQAFIYLYNAGIKHRDIHAGNVLVKKERFGKVKSVLFDFDRVEWFPKSRKLLDVNTRPTKDFGFSHDYACNNFQKAPLLHILGTIPMDADIQSHAIIPEDRNKIKQYIKETVASQKTAPQRLTKTKLEAATKAYISLHRVVKIARQSQDCSSFVAALKTVYPLSLQKLTRKQIRMKHLRSASQKPIQ